MNDVERKKERDWRDQKKRLLALHCAAHDNEYCPNEVVNERGIKTRITWAQLFRNKYKQSLQEYIAEGGL